MLTRDEIIRMALEARLTIRCHYDDYGSTPLELLRFAELVSASEREACAKVCDELAMKNENAAQEAESDDDATGLRAAAWQISICAAAIRNRK